MHVILWRYRVRPGREREFEAAYGPDGAWARLFGADPGFLGTELMRASDEAYLTLDRWMSGEAFDAFHARNAVAYAALDADCATLTECETSLGAVEV